MRYIVILLIVFVVTFYLVQSRVIKFSPISTPTTTPSTAPNGSQQVLGQQTKYTDCIAHDGLPDRACTPGDIFPNAAAEQICKRGYSASVRNVPSAVKRQVYEEYNIITHRRGEYEVDHLISLELGGSNDISNLWPEAAEPRPGFHEKDAVENYLHEQLCSGKMTLQQVQTAIANNWLDIYKQIPDPKKYNFYSD